MTDIPDSQRTFRDAVSSSASEPSHSCCKTSHQPPRSARHASTEGQNAFLLLTTFLSLHSQVFRSLSYNTIVAVIIYSIQSPIKEAVININARFELPRLLLDKPRRLINNQQRPEQSSRAPSI
jgi:hypothetical protein